jgi:long-subunit fatty acid transport protein
MIPPIPTCLTLDGQLSLAYKLDDRISIGGGINVQYAYGKLTSAMPALDARRNVDGVNSMKADDVSLGWNSRRSHSPRETASKLGIRLPLAHQSRVEG